MSQILDFKSFVSLLDSLGDVTLTSGCFDPIHSGHIEFLKWAASREGKLAVILESDSHVAEKHPVFSSVQERAQILGALNYVDFVIYQESNQSVAQAIAIIKPRYFAKGADRIDNLPAEELQACVDVNTEIIFASTALRSSSAALNDYFFRELDRNLNKLETELIHSRNVDTNQVFDENYFHSEWRVDGDSYHIESRRKIEGRHPELIREVFSEVDSAVDVGCGTGALMLFLEEQGLIVDGIDISNVARDLSPDHLKERIKIRDLTNSTSTEKYDLVICREVLEHVPFYKYLTFVNNLCELTSKYIYVTTRFAKSPSSLFEIQTEFEADPTHITLPPIELLRMLIAMKGFRRNTEMELKLDWMKKGRVLVYEKL